MHQIFHMVEIFDAEHETDSGCSPVALSLLYKLSKIYLEKQDLFYALWTSKNIIQKYSAKNVPFCFNL